MLLHWATLVPEGPDKLAAIRFTGAVRVKSISLFPTGAKPFVNSPDIIARTEPESFFAQVYLNALPLDPAEKSARPPNALVATSIAYAGSAVEFTLPSFEYATRLLIFHGDFDALSVSIHGDMVTEAPQPPTAYTSSSLNAIIPTPLSPALDLANAQDPTALASSLLSMLPDPPPLTLLTRLMFCLKASTEDWDLPEFPYVFANWEDPYEDIDSAVSCTKKPVKDDVTAEEAERFTTMAITALDDRNSDYAPDIAALLYNLACQPPIMLETFLPQLPLELVFNLDNMDEDIILDLLDASANPTVAEYLDQSPFTDMLETITGSYKADKQAQSAARQLIKRLRGWRVLKMALSTPESDFVASAAVIQDVASEEQCFAIWLASFLTQEDLKSKVQHTPEIMVSRPPLLLSSTQPVTRSEFNAFLKAFIGVSSVLVVLAWADSIGDDPLRERSLAVLQLWQNADGYREIVNKLLLMRQFANRLEWITENGPPRNSAKLAESILSGLVAEPTATLNSNVIRTVLSLEQPLTYICEHDRLLLRKVALVAEDGISAAVEELTYPSDRPLSFRRARTLRVALAIVERDLSTADGEYSVLQEFWAVSSQSFIGLMSELACSVEEDLRYHFIQPPPLTPQFATEQLLLLAAEALQLIRKLLSVGHQLPPRWMRQLVRAVVNLSVHADIVKRTYSPENSCHISATATIESCAEILHSLTLPDIVAEGARSPTQLVFKALLDSDLYEDVDPISHTSQVYRLFMRLLPGSATSAEGIHIRAALPHILTQLQTLMDRIDMGNQVELLGRLIAIDNNQTGVGQWLLLQRLHSLHGLLELMQGSAMPEGVLKVKMVAASRSLGFLAYLVEPASRTASWCTSLLGEDIDTSEAVEACLRAAVSTNVSSPHLRSISIALASYLSLFTPKLASTTVLCLFHSMADPSVVASSLGALADHDTDTDLLRREIAHYLCSLTDIGDGKEILRILQWAVARDNTTYASLALSPQEGARILDNLSTRLPDHLAGDLSALRSSLSFSAIDGETPVPITLEDSLELSLDALLTLLNPPPSTPPLTPKGTLTPDVLGLLDSSPPTALFRSPTAVGLTKTYLNNDFRQLRQLSVRQNTSRLPSMHVDEFEMSSLVSTSSSMVPTGMHLADDAGPSYVSSEMSFL